MARRGSPRSPQARLLTVARRRLNGLLERVAPSPMVTLNRAMAVAMVPGPEAGLDLVATVDVDSTTWPRSVPTS